MNNTDIIQRAKLLVAMQQTQNDLLNVIIPALGYLDRESNEELIQLLRLAADALQRKIGEANITLGLNELSRFAGAKGAALESIWFEPGVGSIRCCLTFNRSVREWASNADARRSFRTAGLAKALREPSSRLNGFADGDERQWPYSRAAVRGRTNHRQRGGKVRR